ncbi:MAG TPA: hypothetical protein VFI57_13645, partial [Pyrinomonadaceae bacterium]|nr:hypothetical protein [Pyrinomonadaceae bacterium]
VGVRPVNSNGRNNAPIVVTTDPLGSYRISNIPSGEYEVIPAAPQFVVSGSQSMKRLIVGEGESFEGVDFALVRGGVITGKVTDAEGRPVIEETIELIGAEGPNMDSVSRVNFAFNSTDDRGIYRIFGVPPGKYKVAAGTAEERLNLGRSGRSVFTQTFYPSTTELANATVVEVTEGSETINVDISLRRKQGVFTVTGLIVDADTGKPIANATFGLQKFRENGSSASGGIPSNQLGEIKLENVTPGKYAIYLDPSPLRPVYAEPVRFEVVDQDVKDLVLRASSGSSMSGVIVLEGVDEKISRIKLAELMVFAHITNRDENSLGGGSMPFGAVNADGAFTVNGLRPGTVSFSVWAARGGPRGDYEVARVERDGVAQPNLEIKAREQVKGLRLIVKLRSGRIHGVVKFENGQQTSAPLQIYIKRVGDEQFTTSAQLDDRGRFMTEPLAAGVYDVMVIAYPANYRRPPSVRQQVVVADNQVSEVTMTLDLKMGSGERRP